MRKSKSKEIETVATLDLGSPKQIIYADKIVNIGVGIGVSRLTLALESDDTNVSAFAQVVMPTANLFEAVEFMANALNNNADLKKKLAIAMDEFRNKLEPS